MSKQWQFYVKALWAGLIALLGAVGGGLAALGDGASIGTLPDAVWVAGAGAFLLAFGGILGWQNASAGISTGIK